jgi:hypothetical protein
MDTALRYVFEARILRDAKFVKVDEAPSDIRRTLVSAVQLLVVDLSRIRC